MRDDNQLDTLATQLWELPRTEAVALMAAIERGTTESLTDHDLIDRARKAAAGARA